MPFLDRDEVRSCVVSPDEVRINIIRHQIRFLRLFGFVAGGVPRVSRKRIAADFYALKDSNRKFLKEEEQDVRSSANLLTTLNQPQKRRLTPQFICNLDFSLKHKDNREKGYN